MAADRREYQRNYYQQRKKARNRPVQLELTGLFVTYLLSMMISFHAFQHFSTSFSSIEKWFFLGAVEILIFALSFTLSGVKGLAYLGWLLTIVVLTMGINIMVSKGAFDIFLRQRQRNDQIEHELKMLKTSVSQIDLAIDAFQTREMHSKAIELLKKKDVLIQSIDRLKKSSVYNGKLENDVIVIIMRIFVSIINILVVNRMGRLIKGREQATNSRPSKA